MNIKNIMLVFIDLLHISGCLCYGGECLGGEIVDLIYGK